MSRWSVTTLSSLVLAIAFSFAASRAPTPLQSSGQELYTNRPECPHSYDKLAAPDTNALDNGPRIDAPASFSADAFSATSDIPEFNDCQRIILESGREYGPLMSVFASDRLAHMLFGHTMTDSARALAAVQILNYSRGYYYHPLDIRPLFNCLYVWGYAGHWQAKIVWKRADNTCTPIANASAMEGTRLSVIEAPRGGFTAPSQYPAAARWEWDSKDNIQYIGMRCGNAWCQVGRAAADGSPRFQPARPYIYPPADPGPNDRVRAIKGWYDEQRLAFVSKVGARHFAQVSSVTGRVFPAPDLDHYQRDEDFAAFRPVAYIALETTSPADPAVGYYKRKFNYDVLPRGSALKRMTELALCYGSWRDCAGPQARAESRRVIAGSCNLGTLAFEHLASDMGKRWWGRLTSRVTGPPIYRCVTQRKHDLVPDFMPATARWRWLASDETTWDYCERGCCETEGGQ